MSLEQKVNELEKRVAQLEEKATAAMAAPRKEYTRTHHDWTYFRDLVLKNQKDNASDHGDNQGSAIRGDENER
ncbi:hypothetical protein [Priestia megaterium]|uniref:hypothetical protein n=1 Tax=Priestia megaterium TaxID=1404 RepID=UPI001A95256B|nr:hypothetical protein [Priestia megaterium]QSX20029.1 hypothetical protein J0P05_22770 [Priestia megaterium]